MPVLDHLRELRKRMLLALTGVGIASIAGWFLVDPVFAQLRHPLDQLSEVNAQLNFQTVGAALDLRFTFALTIGILLSSPWWIYQIGRFIWPGLLRNERINILLFGMAGILLFGAGAAAGWMFAPRAISVLLSFVPEGGAVLLRVDSYVHFYLMVVAAFAVSALFPLVLVALNRAGLLRVRKMLRGWRWAVIGAFVFAAITNPLPNPLPMVIQALALVALFFAAVGTSALLERQSSRKHAQLRDASSLSAAD